MVLYWRKVNEFFNIYFIESDRHIECLVFYLYLFKERVTHKFLHRL